MKRKSSSKRILKLIIALAIVACLGYGGFRIYGHLTGINRAEQTINTLKTVIPGLGVDSDASTGAGRDPLAAVSIDGIDIVGVIEIPALDIMAPVAAKGVDEEYFASLLEGSPMQDQFEILGGRNDVFREISQLNPGDRVVFTDIDGVRYSYEVITQYHLKKWDKGDNDLLLCCETDDKTFFVVGCTALK